MTSKGQKFIRFTNEELTEIVGKYVSSQYGYKTLAKEYGISWKIVELMVKKYKRT